MLYFVIKENTWEALGTCSSNPDEEALTISFPFWGRPPTAREARRSVQELLLADDDFKWFSVHRGKWHLDLARLRTFLELTAPKFDWLMDGLIAVEPEYQVEQDTWDKQKFQGVLRIVLDRLIIEEGRANGAVAEPREKQQKFKILDAPNLLSSDLEACRGAPGTLGTAVVFFDLDHFKALNTALSEREVDRSILPQIHGCIRDTTAHLGFSYAEGGDEFVVLLPNANEAIAVAVAEGLRAAISALELSAKGTIHRVTASFGVAVSDAWALDELPDAANAAKTDAKVQGRNRVVVARRQIS